MPYKYYLIYKPFGYLSQFTKEVPTHQVLGDLFDFPSDVYPIGRLDRDSEGLLLLSNDKQLNHRLLDPKFQHRRTYWVQVEGNPSEEQVKELETGVTIRINKKNYTTRPAKASILNPIPDLEARTPPIRYRANIPETWIELTLTEGKNRQVRRMCAKIGFPVLRLVRQSIEGVNIGKLNIGAVRELEKEELYRLLKLSF